MKKLKKYRCSEAKGLRMKKVLEIIERMLEDKNVGERENIFHYMYHQELAEPALKDDQLQKRIGRAILTISEMLRVSRESLKIRPACKGLILGPVHLFHGNDLICNCNLGGESGSLIPSEADLISNIEATGTVKYVLVIEKDTVFHYLAGKNFHRSERCILICGKGQPDVATRILLRKLKDKFPLVRFYAFVDFNPSGLGIFWTYCFGSDVRAHDNLLLTVSDLEFIGLHPDDVKVEELMPFENSDAARLISLMNKSYLVKDRGLREALFQLDARQSKADIEVLMKRKVLMDVIRNRINFSEENTIAAEVDDVAGQLEAAHMLDTTE